MKIPTISDVTEIILKLESEFSFLSLEKLLMSGNHCRLRVKGYAPINVSPREGVVGLPQANRQFWKIGVIPYPHAFKFRRNFFEIF